MPGHPPSEQKVWIHHHQLGQGSKCVAYSECKQGALGGIQPINMYTEYT